MPPGPGILESLRRRAFEECIPLNCVIELSLKCNLRCVHCYNFDRAAPYPKERAGDELNDDEVLALIDAVRSEGCLFMAFTGGEAMMHPRLLDFVRHAVAQHLSVRVKTNGTLLTPRRAAELTDAGASWLDISLYGGSATSHDAFTLKPGSWDRTLAGIDHALAAGLGVTVNICLVRSNVHEIEDMLALGPRLGIQVNLDSQITERYDGTDSSLEHRLDPAALARLYRGPLAAQVAHPPQYDLEKPPQCICARSNCAIAANGDVYPCIGAPLTAGNVRRQSFAEIWRDSPQLNWIRGLGLDDFATCKPCPDRAFCQRSSGMVYINTGDYTGAEPWLCADANLRHRIHEELSAEGDAPEVGVPATLRRHSVDG